MRNAQATHMQTSRLRRWTMWTLLRRNLATVAVMAAERGANAEVLDKRTRT